MKRFARLTVLAVLVLCLPAVSSFAEPPKKLRGVVINIDPIETEEKKDFPGGLFTGDLTADEALQRAQDGSSDGISPGDARAQVVSLDTALAAYDKGDFQTAYRGFYPLARKGNAGAQEIVGVMFLNGQGQEIDEEAAAKWLTKAAEQNRPLAQHYLGVMYENGTGVEQDSVLALMWLELAISNYPPGASQDRAIQDRDNVALQISSNQQARARAMVAEWKQQHQGAESEGEQEPQ